MKQKTRFAYIIVFLVLSVFGINACGMGNAEDMTPQSIAALDEDIIKHTASENMQYIRENISQSPSEISIGVILSGQRQIPITQLPQNREFRIAQGEDLSLDLILAAGEETTLLVTALVDYTQIPFRLDGEIGLLHEIQIEAEKDLFIPVELTITGTGAHDVLLIAFKNPYQRPLDQDYRISQCRAGGFRTVVIVGEDDHPVIDPQPNAWGNPLPPGVDWGPPLLFATADNIHPSESAGQLQMFQKAKPGDLFSYRIWLSNAGREEKRTIDIAMVQFMNYHQTVFREMDWYMVRLTGDQEILLNDSLVLPDVHGVNEVQIIYTNYPFTSLENEVDIMPFVYFSDCLGIQTK